ncbi:MAG TPA: hypothetical protein VFN30_10740 [Chitinophagaceae bacterium]|nr:hypothetical protein [Chitinophagaceae bacterium]
MNNHIGRLKRKTIDNKGLNEMHGTNSLVEKILEKKQENKETIDLENQLDQLVYQLYELTEEEIKIIENA